MIRIRPGRSVTSQLPSGRAASPQGCSSPEATTAWLMVTSVRTPGARVWPAKAGVWFVPLGARVSTGAPGAAAICPV